MVDNLGRSSGSLNDMIFVELPPLTHSDAINLTSALLEAEGISGNELSHLARLFALESADYPIDINALAREVAASPLPVDAQAAESLLGTLRQA